MNIQTLQKKIHHINKQKGFWNNERNIGELLMLVTSELGEAIEAHRKGRRADIKEYISNVVDNGKSFDKEFFQEDIKDTFEDEIADAVIRLLDMAEGLGIDLQFHIDQKIKYNKTREQLHGKKY